MALPEGLIAYATAAVGSVLAPMVFGLGLVRRLGLGPEHGLRIGLAFGYVIGHYVLAHLTYAWLALRQPVPGWCLPLLALAFGAWLLRRPPAPRHASLPSPRAASTSPGPHWPRWPWLPRAVLLLLVVWLLDQCLATNAAPIRFSDEADNWAAKAKVLYTAPDFALKEGLDFFVQHPDYPLFNPLLQVLAFASVGRVLHFENRLPIQGFAVVLLCLLSAASLRRARALPSTLALLAFAGTSFASAAPTGYADVMLATATFAACEALLRARETGAPVWWRLACLCFGAMIATKNEGSLLMLSLLGAFAVVWLSERRGRSAAVLPWRAAGWLAVPLAAIAVQRAFNHWFAVRNDLFDPALGRGRGLLERIADQLTSHGPGVLDYYLRMAVDASAHRLLPLLFVLTVPLALLVHRRHWLGGATPPLLLAFTGATLGYMLVFTGTVYDLGWHLDVAADRTMLHVLPIAVLGLCTQVWPVAPGLARVDAERRGAAEPPS